MVEIKGNIVICGMICLTIIYVALLAAGRDDSAIGFAIVASISMAAGVVMPSPKVNKDGVLRW